MERCCHALCILSADVTKSMKSLRGTYFDNLIDIFRICVKGWIVFEVYRAKSAFSGSHAFENVRHENK